MKKKSWTILGITFLIILAIIFFLIRPTIVSVLESWQNLEQAKGELKAAEEKKEILNTLRANKDLNLVAEIAKKYLPQEPEVGQLVIELTSLAEANNLKVESTTFGKEGESGQGNKEGTTPTPQTTTSGAPAQSSQVMGFDLILSGTFLSLINYVQVLEKSSRLITLETVSLTQLKGEQTAGATAAPSGITAQISGQAYFKKEVSIEKNLENLKVSEETLKTFLNLKTYSQTINLPAESGFGRSDPFEEY